MRLPHRSQHRADHDDPADEKEPCEETEDHADRAVGVAVGDDQGREVDGGEHPEAKPEKSRSQGWSDQAAGVRSHPVRSLAVAPRADWPLSSCTSADPLVNERWT